MVLTCEHAGRAVPATLADDAPHDDNMARQLAYDLGVARAFAERLDAPLALHRPYRQAVDGMIEVLRPTGTPLGTQLHEAAPRH